MPASPPISSPSEPDRVPGLSRRGPDPFAHLYLALFVQSVVLVHAVHAGRPEARFWMWGLGALLGLAAMATAALRIALLDWFAMMTPMGNIGRATVVAGFFLAPLWIEDLAIIPDTFVFGLVPLLVMAVDASSARILLLYLIGVFWFLGLTPHPPGIETILAFGAATLWSFSSAHFAFTGEPFGLRGWWPARRVWLTVALYFIPAALSAWLAWTFWPESPASGFWRASVTDAPAVRIRPSPQVSSGEIGKALIKLSIYLGACIAALVGLHLFRRMLSRRAKPVRLPKIRGSDMSMLTMSQREPPSAPRSLAGRRGEIVRLWRRWARSFEAEGRGRAPGETAREMANRIADEDGGHPAPDPAVTRMMEAAHYGPADPAPRDVDRMRSLVRAELKKRGD